MIAMAISNEQPRLRVSTPSAEVMEAHNIVVYKRAARTDKRVAYPTKFVLKGVSTATKYNVLSLER